MKDSFTKAEAGSNAAVDLDLEAANFDLDLETKSPEELLRIISRDPHVSVDNRLKAINDLQVEAAKKICNRNINAKPLPEFLPADPTNHPDAWLVVHLGIPDGPAPHGVLSNTIIGLTLEDPDGTLFSKTITKGINWLPAFWQGSFEAKIWSDMVEAGIVEVHGPGQKYDFTRLPANLREASAHAAYVACRDVRILNWYRDLVGKG